jgi:hypothetical protein
MAGDDGDLLHSTSSGRLARTRFVARRVIARAPPDASGTLDRRVLWAPVTRPHKHHQGSGANVTVGRMAKRVVGTPYAGDDSLSVTGTTNGKDSS